VAKAASIELGPYQLLERIGEGGSGQIYRATGPAGAVAVKVLGPAADLDDAARARFGREIAALGQLSHPNLVPLLDHGIDAELGPYLVLPLLAGTNLRALLGGKAVCPEAAILIAQPIVAATAALHAAGFVHRDLKPENAIAAPDGTLTVIDLGLAWREGMTRHTDDGAAVGSVGYMAPEQVDGRTVEARADVWALGVMIYEWIAGKRPFQRGRAAEEAAAVLLGQCARLSAADRRASDELADLVARCLASDPQKRPTAADLAAALAAMIDWSDDVTGERAAAVADPMGYQARVAPFRVRRVERIAREALAAGKPFVALAACDRGLAYAPEHAPLLELVASTEAATARAPVTRRARRWPWVAVAAGGVVAGALGVYALVPAHARDPWAEPAPAAPPPAPSVQHADDSDRQLVHDFVGVFEEAMANRTDQPGATPLGGPTTASGWLQLAATQKPADAVASIRHALALNPTWLDAQIELCAALAATRDDGAIEACDIVLRRRPDLVPALAARAAAEQYAGKLDAALADIDRAVKADPDPRWRRLRAKIREAKGDHAGAQHDLDAACQLGDAQACH
jgi:tetratricopeptide (TPR) repeat protein